MLTTPAPAGSTTPAPTDLEPSASGERPSPPGFDPSRPWVRSPKIGLRPEPFGALAYHFDTRRLVFLKSPTLVDLVDGLADHPTAADAIDAIVAPIDERGRTAHVKALASLAEAGVIEPAEAPPIGFVG